MLSSNYLKQIFIVLVTIFSFSCQIVPVAENDETEVQPKSRLENLKPQDFEIIVIDGCEYLLFEDNFNHASQGFGFMAHKGNCTNPIHCYNN